MVEEEEVGEGDRQEDRQSPQGEQGGAGHLPTEVERGKQERHPRMGCGIQGEGLANHPVEEEGVGSLSINK